MPCFLSNSLQPQYRSCRPNTATGEQMIRVALAYIERRPERMHEDFRTLVIEAWHEAWPCN
jgi:Rap1a immunity proteins